MSTAKYRRFRLCLNKLILYFVIAFIYFDMYTVNRGRMTFELAVHYSLKYFLLW